MDNVLVVACLVNAAGLLVAGIAMWRLPPPPYLHTLWRLFGALGVVGCLSNLRGAWVAHHYGIASWSGLGIRFLVAICVVIWLWSLWKHRTFDRRLI